VRDSSSFPKRKIHPKQTYTYEHALLCVALCPKNKKNEVTSFKRRQMDAAEMAPEPIFIFNTEDSHP
jgi:hypothetical protein